MKNNYESEFNDISPSNSKQLKGINDQATYTPPPSANSLKAQSEHGRSNPVKSYAKAKKAGGIFNRIMMTIAAVAAATVISIPGLNILVKSAKTVTPWDLDLITGNDYVQYTLDAPDDIARAEDGSISKELTVKIYNFFTDRSRTVVYDGEVCTGGEEGLARNMQYTIEVLDGKEVVAKKSFRTVKSYYLFVEPQITGAAFSFGVPEGKENERYTALLIGERGDTEIDVSPEEPQEFGGLAPSTNYELRIICGGKTVIKKAFRTLEEEPNGGETGGNGDNTGDGGETGNNGDNTGDGGETGDNDDTGGYKASVVPGNDFVAVMISGGDPTAEETITVSVYDASGEEAATARTNTGNEEELGGLQPATEYVLKAFDVDGRELLSESFTTLEQ